MSDPLMAPTYAEIARAYRHFTRLNGSSVALEYLLAAGVTGGGLQTWLGAASNLAAFQQLVSTPSGASAMCASGTAMAAVAASSAAMAAVAASSTAMAAVAASSAAMAAVAASSTAMAAVAASGAAMAAVAASSTARIAVYDSQDAWGALVASTTAKAALSARAVDHSTASTSHNFPPGSGGWVRVALIQQRGSSTSYPSLAGAWADTYNTTSTSYIDRYVKVTGLTHRTTSDSYPSHIRYVIMQ